jgi:glutathione S-transferase
MTNDLPRPCELITIPISHYCEKVRWALDHLGVAYVERPHMPPFHRSATKRHGGGAVPVLVTDIGPIQDSDTILRFLDQRTPGKLYPLDAAARAKAAALETLFNDAVGVQTRKWGYSYILTPELARAPWTHGVPFWERWLFPLIFSKLESRVRTMMAISPTSASEAYSELLKAFAEIERTLSDGRKYLLGDQFSAADITFASLAAPLLMPPNHHVPPTPLASLPKQMQIEVEAARATVAGQFGLRLYRENRYPAANPVAIDRAIGSALPA